MKRKDVITLLAAALFAVTVLAGNAAVAHDGAEQCPPAQCNPNPVRTVNT